MAGKALETRSHKERSCGQSYRARSHRTHKRDFHSRESTDKATITIYDSFINAFILITHSHNDSPIAAQTTVTTIIHSTTISVCKPCLFKPSQFTCAAPGLIRRSRPRHQTALRIFLIVFV